MKPDHLVVQSIWDEEAKIWIATSKDVPGLVVEAASLDELAKEVTSLVPQLLALHNSQSPDQAPREVPIEMRQRVMVTV